MANEIFILFNEEEKLVADIVKELEARGYSTYFWRRDIPAGAEWEDFEAQKLREADIVMVFLGNYGWGPNHLRITIEALQLEKKMIPVLIGDPPTDAFEKANSLFKIRRYIDVKSLNDRSLNQLIEALGPEIRYSITIRFDKFINTIVDGNEEQRAEILRQVQLSKNYDRNALSNRLRKEISGRFCPGKEMEYVSVIRDAKKISSIRSWMLSALIWIDPEDPLNRSLLLNHVNLRIEPDSNVRYWTLGGLYQNNVSYLKEAVEIAMKDEIGVVKLLARAIDAPNDEQTISKFKAALGSSDEKEIWEILRILRIVPIPSLANEVFKLLNRDSFDDNIAYDAFYALSTPEMAREVREIFINEWGIKKVINTIAKVMAGSNSNGIRNFSRMLLAFDQQEVDTYLDELRFDTQYRDIVNEIKGNLVTFRSGGEITAVSIPGYSSDTLNVEVDYLDIQEDVQTLTSVILAREAQPPLAIGLFGDWGTGKSFFMQSIKAEVIKLQRKNKDKPHSPFCQHIVQIEFNAWHYVDTNLWASLVSYILEQLASHVSPATTVEEQQAQFIAELASTKSIVKEAEMQKEQAKKEVEEGQVKLKELQAEREKKRISLKDLRLEDIHSLLQDSEKKELAESLDKVGVPSVINSINDLNTVVSDAYTVRGRIISLFLSILKSNNWPLIIFLLVLMLGVIPAALWFIHTYFDINRLVTNVAAYVTELLAIISIISIIIKKGLKQVQDSIAVIEKTKKNIDLLIADKKKNPTPDEIALEKEIAILTAKEQEAVSRLSSATTRALDLEERLRSLKEEISLNTFLSQRTQSEDYRKHLGIISIIRQDFDNLTKRLSNYNGSKDDNFNPVDRIILYIDDLDRCPSSKVMEVLQAVHLLLAYPLFVVVVGVDPRWLLHSLATNHTAFQNNGDGLTTDANLWCTTPQNFLEKIFQIPFSLNPMTNKGFDDLIDGLLVPSNTATPFEESANINNPQNQEKLATPINALKELSKEPSTENRDTNFKVTDFKNEMGEKRTELEKKEGLNSKNKNERFILNEESLKIKSWEANFAHGLFIFITTPRSAKRFSNVYRILKASVRKEKLSDFEGTSVMPGEFQIPMFLLAILTGTPSVAVVLFPLLQEGARTTKRNKEVWRDLKGAEKLSDISPRTMNQLTTIIERDWFPQNSELMMEWIPKVSRFSFELGKIIS